jgi:3-hydroxybutyrate dehydrogenase
MQLEKRVAGVTGGSAGIGLGIAKAYLDEGAKVAIFARNREKGEAAVAGLNAGDRCVFIAGDAMVQSDVEGFVDSTIAQFGKIDILVNNAGGAGDLQPMLNL